VVLVGVRDHAEIWEKSAWDSLLAENVPRFDDLGSQALD
jgi:DNA-binding transcriptional regulator/RsmH inhibitor MraZ